MRVYFYLMFWMSDPRVESSGNMGGVVGVVVRGRVGRD